MIARASFAGLALLLVGSCGERTADAVSGQRPPNILLLVVDTLRPDRMGCYGAARPTTPNCDALAAEGVLFERAISSAPWTKPAFGSIFTGKYPSTHGVTEVRHRLPQEALTLAEILKSEGYATACVTSNALLGEGYGFEQGFDRYDDSEALGNEHLSTPGLTEKAIAELESWADTERPFFLSVVYFDPHYRYTAHADIDFAPERVGRLEGAEPIQTLRNLSPPITDDEAEFARALYDEEIRFTDRGIGTLLERLDALGLADETVVVLTSDHGEEFGEHGWIGHTRNLHDGLLHVPLILRGPGVTPAAKRIDGTVSMISLCPTLIEVAGLAPADYDFQGRSLIELWTSDETRAPGIAFSEVGYVPFGKLELDKRAEMRAITTDSLKLIRDDGGKAWALYDLNADPSELRNVAEARADDVQALRNLLKARTHEARRGPGEVDGIELSEEEMELLRQLGYADR